VPFLSHDSDLSTTTPCRGPFESLSAAEIELCPLKALSHGPERFEAALQWSRGRVVIDAEFKSESVVRPAIDLVRKYSAYEWVYFQVRSSMDLYEQARRYDPRVALEAAPMGARAQEMLDRLLEIGDPRLVSIQLHPDLASRANISAIRRSGKVTSADGFRFGEERRWAVWPFRTAFCARLFQLGINIAVSNAPESCVDQRNAASFSLFSVTVSK
jgi:hypothetical protein